MTTPFRIILSFFSKYAAAKDFLRDYLKGHVHPRFLTNVDISKAANKPYMWAVQQLDRDIDREQFEDTIMLALAGIRWSELDKPVKELRKIFRTEGGKTALPKKGLGGDLAGDLAEAIRKKMGISEDEADELVDPVGSPGEHTMDKSVLTGMRDFVYKWLENRFRQLAGDWIKYMKAQKRTDLPTQRTQKQEFTEDIFGRGSVPSDEELANEAVRQQGLEKKTYLKTLKFISGMKEPELNKAILHYRIMGIGGSKTYKEIAEMFGKDDPKRVQEKERQLLQKLKELFGADVDTKKEVKEEIEEGGDPKKSPKEEAKETVAEGMGLLKDKSNREKFLSYFFEHKRTKPDSQAGKTIKMLAEGKTPAEIAEALDANKQVINNEKNRRFVPMLREWVEEEIRTACARIKVALLILNKAPLGVIREAATKRVPYKPSGEEQGETPAEATPAHRRIVEQRLPRTLVTVHFSSPMDWLDIQKKLKGKDLASEEGRKLINEVEDKFKFEKYEAVFDERRTFGRNDLTVNYTFEQDLSPDGKFVGQPKSSMRINGKRVKDDDPVKQILDEFVENMKKKHGLWAGGKKFKRGVMPAQFQYVNETKNQTLTPSQAMKLYPPGISKDDPVHKEVREEHKRLEFRKILGPSESRDWKKLERQTKSTIRRIKDLISEEKKKSKTDPDKIKKYQDWIQRLQKGLEEEQTKELKEELDESRQFLESEEEYWAKQEVLEVAEKVKERLNQLMEREEIKGDAKDPEKLKEIDKLVSDIDKAIQSDKVDRIKKATEDAQKFISELQKKTAALEKYAQGIGEPSSEEAKDFVELAKKYEKQYQQLGGKSFSLPLMTSWKGPGDVIGIAASLSNMLDDLLKKKLDKIKKDRGPMKGLPREEAQEAKAEDAKAAEAAKKEISKARDRLSELYRSFVGDLKNRITDVIEKRDSAQKKIQELQDKKKKGEGNIVQIMDQIKKLQQEASKFESMTKRIRNFDWVTNSSRLGDVIQKGEKYLEAPVDLKQKKEPTINVVEVRKYESLKGYLQSLMDAFSRIADNLDDAPLKPIAERETTERYKADADMLKEKADDIREEIREITKTKTKDISPEERKQIEQMEKAYKSIHEDIKKKLDLFKDLKTIQAVYPARVAWRALSYFSELYNLLSSYLWFRQAQPGRKAYDIIGAADEDGGSSRLETIKSDAAKAIKRLSRYDIMNASAVKKDVQTAKNLLNKMFDELNVSRHASMVELPYQPIEKSAAKDDKKKERLERRKSLLPGSLVNKANELIKSLGQEKLVETIGKNLQQEAKNDLEDLKEALTEYQEDRPTVEEIKKKAQKWGISFNQMQNIMKQLDDSFIVEAFNTYINEWMDRVEAEKERAENEKAQKSKRGPRPERKGPFMLLPADKYEEIPKLLQRAGIEIGETEEKGEEKVEPAKKTPRSVAKAIEKAWEQHFTPEQIKKAIQGEKLGGKFLDKVRLLYESELNKWGFGGSDKVKSKSRPKAPKTPPPAITREQMQKFLKQWIKDKPAGQIVSDWLNLMLTKIKRAQKEGTVYDKETLVNAIVYHLKSLKTLITSLDVGPSGTYERRVTPPARMQQKPVLAVAPGGAPDISFDSKEEALALWDKIAEIYKRINRYIKPEDIVTVPKNPSKANLKKFYGDMPRGLVDWYQDIGEEEKTASEWKEFREKYDIQPNTLSYNVLMKFADSRDQGNPVSLEEHFNLIQR